MIESQIDGAFNGWSGETIFSLTNGQFWVQASYAYHYRYAYRRTVWIENGLLSVEGVMGEIEVRQTQGLKSKIADAFNGWRGDTVVTLTNGQVWQQSRYKYQYKYAYRPDVVVVQNGQWLMSVSGTPSVAVRRLS